MMLNLNNCSNHSLHAVEKVIVSGANGFIGSALTKYLLAHDIEIWALIRRGSSMDITAGNSLHIVEADFEDYLNLDKLIGTRGFDVFFHCAFSGGFSSAALKDYKLQLDNTRFSCDAVQAALHMSTKKFVLASTVNAVEIKSFLELENFSPRYTCIYGTAKIAAELIGKTLARNAGMEYCTALIAMPFGEGNAAQTLPNVVMKQLCLGARPKLIEGNNLYDLIYIDDVAAGLAAIGIDGRDFVDYYVGHRELKTFKKIIQEIRDVLVPDMELTFGEYPDSPALDYSLIDLNALYRDTGFECKTDFKEGILMTAKWLSEQMFVGGGV